MKKIISNTLVSLGIASAVAMSGASPAFAETDTYGPLTGQPSEITRSPVETSRTLNNFWHFLGFGWSDSPEAQERITLSDAFTAFNAGEWEWAEVSKLIKEELIELLLTPSPS